MPLLYAWGAPCGPMPAASSLPQRPPKGLNLLPAQRAGLQGRSRPTLFLLPGGQLVTALFSEHREISARVRPLTVNLGEQHEDMPAETKKVPGSRHLGTLVPALSSSGWPLSELQR